MRVGQAAVTTGVSTKALRYYEAWAGATDPAGQRLPGLQRSRRPARFGLGAVLTISNPQALLFYITVLPSVLDSDRVQLGEYLMQCLALSAVMAVIAIGYIGLATRARSALSHSRRRVADRVSAVLLGIVGVVVASH